MVTEIVSASHEQAGGIEQVNQAMTQMRQVVQQTTANADEGASASEELNAQEVQMKEMVGKLTNIAGGVSGEKPTPKPTRKTGTDTMGDRKALPKPSTKEIRSEEVIPFGEEDGIEDF